MKTVIMPIMKKWFDMILKGEKTEEYRAIKEHWRKRLLHDKTTHLKLINGYGRDKPYLLIELKNISIGTGREEWGAVPGEEYYKLELGEIVEFKNFNKLVCTNCDRTDLGSHSMPFNGYCPITSCLLAYKRYLEGNIEG